MLYRGISLYDAKCMAMQLFVYVINRFVTSDMQLGFKANHSSVMCSPDYIDVINHYLKTAVMYTIVY